MAGRPPRGVAVRRATPDDIPFLARMEREASPASGDETFWDRLLAHTGTTSLALVEALLREGGSYWWTVDDFVVLEVDGLPAGACAVFRPRADAHRRGPIDIEGLERVGRCLAWPPAATAVFRSTYERLWPADSPVFDRWEDAVIEVLAIRPCHRGLGLGHCLVEAAFDRAVDIGARNLGVMAVHDGGPARSLYARHFEPLITFHAASFDHRLPGLTRYRACLPRGGRDRRGRSL